MEGHGCTDVMGFEKVDRSNEKAKADWQQRKRAYLEHVRDASPSVLLVSCADKVHNVGSIIEDVKSVGLSVYDRFTGGEEGTLWYYRELARTFSDIYPSKLSKMLEERVEALVNLTKGS